MTLLALLFVGTGVLLMVISVPLMRRRIAPNSLYGLRVPATFADEWVWYEANARSARDLFLMGLIQIVLAVGLLGIPGVSEQVYALVNAVFISVGAIVAAVVGWRRANRLLDRRRREQDEENVGPERTVD